MNMLLIIFLVAMNVAAFSAFAIDKRRAVSHQRRIPEDTLIMLAIFGGSIGAIVAMWTLRHKTLHNKFRYGLPAILVAQVIFVLVIWAMSQGDGTDWDI